MAKNNLSFGPFSDNPFMMGYDNRIYRRDHSLGFAFPGRRLITPTGFKPLQKIIQDIRFGDRVVLHMGDSSTSGWNSNNVHAGNKNPHAPFFTYKTYAQLIKEQSAVMSVNAGVPGYSSLQGKKYLEQLLQAFAGEGRDVSWVTLYFGNNDATYNNIEDKVRLERKRATPNNDGSRVSIGDYRRNLRDMVETARDYGAEPVFIMPVVRYDWQPGLRSLSYADEFEEALEKLARLNKKVKQDLERARVEFEAGNYEAALALDRVLPRIKLLYQEALQDITHEMHVPLINVQAAIPRTDNGAYFVDYCHPLEPTNQLIADAFFAITGITNTITVTNPGEEKAESSRVPLRYRILEGGIRFLEHFMKPKTAVNTQQDDNPNIYTLS